MRVIIFANGVFPDPQTALQYLQPDDYIIAVDGGTRHALKLGVVPHLLIGDLDSCLSADEARLKTAGTTILRFSPKKDETDLELAIRYAVDHGATEMLIFAALGGRLDQSLANVFLLTLPELRDIDVRIVASGETAFLIHDEARIEGKPGDMVSIVPVGGAAVGVSNDGLEWPLHDETLPLGSPRGISNVLVGAYAVIRVREGMLLCVVARK